MKIDEPKGPRFSLALDLLCEGSSFDFGDINLWINTEEPRGQMEARVRTHWALENITEERARDEIERAKGELADLCLASKVFAQLVQQHPIEYILINDYGSGSVEICRLDGNNLIWASGFKTSG